MNKVQLCSSFNILSRGYIFLWKKKKPLYLRGTFVANDLCPIWKRVEKDWRNCFVNLLNRGLGGNLGLDFLFLDIISTFAL